VTILSSGGEEHLLANACWATAVLTWLRRRRKLVCCAARVRMLSADMVLNITLFGICGGRVLQRYAVFFRLPSSGNDGYSGKNALT